MIGLLIGSLIFVIACGNLYWSFSLFYNSDTLLIPSIYNECVTGHLNWFFWSLPPSRYIFPDIPIYFFCHLFTHNTVVALFINVCLNFLLLTLALLYFLKVFFQLPFQKSFLPVASALALTTLPHLLPAGVPLALFWPSEHAGAIVWSIFSLSVVGEYIRKQSRVLFLSVALVSFFAGFCEPMCFATFLAPACVAVFFWPNKIIKSWQRKAWTIAVLILAAVLGGWTGDRLAPLSPLQYIHQKLPPLHYLIDGLACFSRDIFNPSSYLAEFIFIFGGILLWQGWRKTSADRKDVGLFTSGAALILLPLIASILLGRYSGFYNWRYFPLTILLPLVAICLYCRKQFIFRVFLPGFLLLASLVYWPSYPRWDALEYPASARQLDVLKDRLGLQAGLADYWVARPITFASRRGVIVNSINGDDGSPFLKLVDLSWLGLSFMPGQPLKYNFIITDPWSYPNLIARYGPPEKVYSICLDDKNSFLFLYDHDLSPRLALDPYLWDLLAKRLKDNSYFANRQISRSLALGLSKLIDAQTDLERRYKADK